MGKRTGNPVGRPKGSTSKSRVARRTKAQIAIDKIESKLEKPFKGNSLEFLVSVYKDTSLGLDVRMDAAKAAIGYETPRLASTELKGSTEHPLTVLLDQIDGTSRGLPSQSTKQTY